MTNYLIRRSLQMIFVVLLATFAIYVLLNAVPGGPLAGLNQTADPRARLNAEKIGESLGLHRPFALRYLTWLTGEDWLDEVGRLLGNEETWIYYLSPTCEAAGGTNANANPNAKNLPCDRGILRWDFGQTWAIAKGSNVADVIGDSLGNTVRLMTTVTVLSLMIAIPIGIISAVKQYSLLDYTVSTFSFFGTAMPVFWFGLLLILFLGPLGPLKDWGIPFLPSADVTTTRILKGSVNDVFGITNGSVADYIVHMIMPVMMLTLVYLAGWSRFMRSSMLEVLRQDYVRTARAKGLKERVVILKHAARNALIPIVTIVVFAVPDIFSGAVLTETVFNYPGMGRLFIRALGQDDWPIVMAFLFISAILVVIATLVGDILYTIVDPRIRFE